MTHTHRDTTFKISEIIFNMHVLPSKSFEPRKSSNLLRFFQSLQNVIKVYLFDAIF